MKHISTSWDDKVEGGLEDMQLIRDEGGCEGKTAMKPLKTRSLLRWMS